MHIKNFINASGTRSKIFSHMANYFRNEKFKIFEVQKKEINTCRKIINIIILIIKLQSIFIYQLLTNKDIRFL